MPCAITACNIHQLPQSVNVKFPAKRFRGGGDLPQLKAHKELTDEFRSKMLHDNPVRFYRLSEGDIAAALRAKEK
jgi:hypothetical protein